MLRLHFKQPMQKLTSFTATNRTEHNARGFPILSPHFRFLARLPLRPEASTLLTTPDRTLLPSTPNPKPLLGSAPKNQQSKIMQRSIHQTTKTKKWHKTTPIKRRYANYSSLTGRQYKQLVLTRFLSDRWPYPSTLQSPHVQFSLT